MCLLKIVAEENSEGEISVSGNGVSGAKIKMILLFPMLHGHGVSIEY